MPLRTQAVPGQAVGPRWPRSQVVNAWAVAEAPWAGQAAPASTDRPSQRERSNAPPPLDQFGVVPSPAGSRPVLLPDAQTQHKRVDGLAPLASQQCPVPVHNASAGSDPLASGSKGGPLPLEAASQFRRPRRDHRRPICTFERYDASGVALAIF